MIIAIITTDYINPVNIIEFFDDSNFGFIADTYTNYYGILYCI